MRATARFSIYSCVSTRHSKFISHWFLGASNVNQLGDENCWLVSV